MRIKRFIKFLFAIAIAFLLLPAELLAQNVLVQIDDIEPEAVRVAGFQLDNEQEIQIDAVGAHRKSRHWASSAAWILNADNREIVWELTDANSKWKTRKLREYSDAVTLPAGRYEVYYSYYPDYYSDQSWSFTRFFFRRDKDEAYANDDYGEFSIVVRGSGKRLDRTAVEAYRKSIQEKALVSLLVGRDDRYENQGFRLKKPMDVIVYSIGEARGDGAYDYGWIIDADSRKHVWKFNFRHSDPAGGNEKNRMLRETVSLPAGNYAAFYVSDDSHSPGDWNAAPPYDPAFWGISIYAKNDADRNNIELFNYEDIPTKNVILEFTRLRDDEYVSKGFTLKRDMKVRVYALGEGTNGSMYDYGWIVDAKTHQRVWEMRYRDTEEAGGNRKNRMVDEVIELKKGNYIAYFVTDDSHSFRRWNASPPFDQDKWGMTLISQETNFKPGDVTEYNEREDKDVLVQITRVRDMEKRSESFSLKKDGEVRVYALGEGRGGEMFDYAWIEEANTGKVIWEMTYRKTNHAGGDQKNREFNDTVYLKAGDYVLRYESDDSHSFRDWNSAPPRDPENWGVTIYKGDN